MNEKILSRQSCTFLKAICIIMVMAHYTGFPIWGKYFGFTVCSLFFVISGYGLTKSTNDNEWDNVHLTKSLKS